MKFKKLAVLVVVVGVVIGGIVWSKIDTKQSTSHILASCQQEIDKLTQANRPELVNLLNKCSKDLRAECETRVADVDKQLYATSDWQGKKTLWVQRTAIADECLEQWHGGMLDGVNDKPLLGRGEFSESDALERVCQDALGVMDKRLVQESDFDAKWRTFKERQEVVDWCFGEWQSGRHDASRALLLGRGELGETKTMKSICDDTLANLAGQIEKEKDAVKRQKLIKEKDRISAICQEEWQSGRYDQADVPAIDKGQYAPPLVATIEFYNADGDFIKTNSLPFGHVAHFLVVRKDASTDMRTFLPISAKVYVDNALVWSGVSKTDPILACGAPDACSIDGPQALTEWQGRKLRVDVQDLRGNLIAQYTKQQQPEEAR